ncbi:NAD-dependent epimerase/dehydratase family protein [Aliidongia dinghuensis]|nr:NAD-dependent epimerase/dehydratase family protein [Aliidongia dinghuensis]
MFRLLILGGTQFLGRHLVEAALARHHHVTLFTRGKTNPTLFPQIEHLVGDRAGDLRALTGRRWDAVIDTSGYVPRLVRHAALTLEGSVGHYTFVSSISVYSAPLPHGLDEAHPIATRLDDPSTEEIRPATYGPLKARAETAVDAILPGRTLIIRPGLIVGPHDPSDRFSYWPWRLAHGGAVLAPGRQRAPVQVIDVRDLAHWMIAMAESQATGTYNAAGPATSLTMGDLLKTGRAALGASAELHWVDDAFLVSQGIDIDRGIPAETLPLWLPAREKALAGLFTIDCHRAIAAGLRFRPLAETFRDTADWLGTRDSTRQWRAGLSLEREAALLTAWRQERLTGHSAAKRMR